MQEQKAETVGFTTTTSKNWSLTLYEVIAVLGTTVSVSVIVTIWCLTTFQTKDDAIKQKAELEKQIASNSTRIDRAEEREARRDEKLDRMSESVEYIKGRLEPKNQ